VPVKAACTTLMKLTPGAHVPDLRHRDVRCRHDRGDGLHTRRQTGLGQIGLYLLAGKVKFNVKLHGRHIKPFVL